MQPMIAETMFVSALSALVIFWDQIKAREAEIRVNKAVAMMTKSSLFLMERLEDLFFSNDTFNNFFG